VDVLVVLKQPVSLLKFFALNDELETALGCKVDLVTRDSLNPRVRRLALEELRTVYEEVR
jgi:predicted nucleotidyltransferase